MAKLTKLSILYNKKVWVLSESALFHAASSNIPLWFTKLSLFSSASPSDLTKDLNWELLTFTPSVGDKSIPYEGILLSLPRPPGGAPPPLAVFPHGGPHGVYTADFLLWHTGLALLGYTVLLGGWDYISDKTALTFQILAVLIAIWAYNLYSDCLISKLIDAFSSSQNYPSSAV